MSNSGPKIIAGGNEFEILQGIKIYLILSEFRLRHINGDLEKIPTDFRENLKRTKIKTCPQIVSHFWYRPCDVLVSSYMNIHELDCTAIVFPGMAHQ